MANPNQSGPGGEGPFVWAIIEGSKALGDIFRGSPNSNPGPNQTQVLLNAGYTNEVTGQGKNRKSVWTDPQGNVVPQNQVVKTAKQLVRFGVNTSPPPLPIGVLPISPGRPPPRTGTPIPPKYPPPDPNPPWMQPVVPYDPYPPPNYPPPLPGGYGTPGINPNAPGPSADIPWGVFGTFDVFAILREAAAWRLRYGVIGGMAFPKVPPKPPPGKDPGRGDPFPPKGPKITINLPREPKYQLPPELRENIYVPKARMETGPMGKYTIAELERMIATPAPAVVPKWLTLGKYALPLLLPLLTGKQASQSQRQVLNVPDPFGPGSQPDPRLEPQPSVIFGDIGGTAGGGVGSFTCECLPPKKKRRKKKRTVCYTGTYTERADGTRKLKKRKVPCK